MCAQMTRQFIAESLKEKTGLPRHECQQIVNLFFDKITDELVKGEEVKIPRIATFKIHHKNKRIGRNPQTMEEKVIDERYVVQTSYSRWLKRYINDK